MTTLWLIPLALIAGTAAYRALAHLLRELDQAFDVSIDTPADSDRTHGDTHDNY